MGKYLSIVGFGGLVVFALWVLLADRPLDRINRTCAPMNWVTRTFATVGSLFSTRGEATGREVGSDLYQTCRYFAFRQFYGDLYQQLKQQQVGHDKEGAPAAKEGAR